MNAETTPMLAKQDRYGYSLERRRKELANSKSNPASGHDRVVVKGQVMDLEIVRVPIGLPKYRLSNGRTASLQEEWLANNPDKPRDFFEKDPELWSAQEEQHKILKELIKQEGLFELFKDSTQVQVNPIILDENGFVINGNRRLCCWRELNYTRPEDYPHFSHVDVVVLPHCDDKEIDRIEAALQIKKDIRADYSWETRAIMMRQKQRLHKLDDNEVAEIYGIRKTDVEELREMLALASEYLKSRGRENQWSKVGDEYAYRELRKAQQKIAAAGDRELLKRSAFSLIDDPSDVGGRLYSVIPKIQEHFAVVKDKLAKAFPVVAPTEDATTDALFGGSVPAATPDLSIPLAAEITKDENTARARQIIVDVIDSEEELKREKKAGDALLSMVMAANTKLQAAVTAGLRPESSIKGVAAQLDEIEQKLEQIRKWLAGKNA
ncbi:hypothetical protein [Xanthomonas translucens]|uniref:hypothetical protein n=1 Tax=Xanthomonas campestris pv. translucens TaxID=343 RepID=UPI000AF83F65|nr:hypothetical protein [Xanthomonas translucens]QEN94995.1 hypothetical protein F0H33_17970 [Xanthomonas translucens pv. undulosa]QSQ31171.1 hypothetical protein ISN30_04710 [Xanthomonas translucens pv. translucens]